MLSQYAYYIPTKPLLISCLGLIALFLFRKAAASTIHTISMSVLLALLALPFLTRLVPFERVSLPPSLQSTASSSIATERVPVKPITDYGSGDPNSVAVDTSGPGWVVPPGPRVELSIWLLGTALLLTSLCIAY